MDPQAPIIQDPIVPSVPKQSNNGNYVTIFSMALFILLSLSAVAFLYYQNQQLKSMLASYQTQATPTSSATALATADPIANWKTYTNTKYGFELKYPPSYSQIQDKTKYPNSILILSANGKLYDLVVELWSSPSDIVKAYPTTSGNLSSMSLGGNISLTFLKSSNPEIDKILSTFKFVNTSAPTPVSSQKVCTQEAKICPDGSSVERTGPNCEFTACPN